MTKKRLRCAIYTRKSSEEGLDQEFNSLAAQREACEAYIKSQIHEGWALLAGRYDDGGLSGATMNRPGLAVLLREIEASRVDVVVVYKVDRLTRSLSDFARLVEIFDRHSVSFVSVTQQFNTTTSMGRLTLNVLLSFAQFEREVTAERIRDKIAASKKKGMWMGGVVPLGYDVIERKLVVNASEAETVRTIFRLYVGCGNVRRVKEEADRRGLRTKCRRPNNGRRSGGQPFTRGHIYKLLSNPVYIAEITHRSQRFPGEHEPLVDRETWDRVQEQLKENAVRRRTGHNGKSHSVLTGLLVDDDGRRLTPTHATKQGRRYRYYASRRDAQEGLGEQPRWRIPANDIEAAVVGELCAVLQDRRRMLDLVGVAKPKQGTADVLERATRLAGRLAQASPAEQRSLVGSLVTRIELSRERLKLVLRRADLAKTLGEPIPDHPGGDDVVNLELAVRFNHRGRQLKLVMADASNRSVLGPRLVVAVAQAHAWYERIRSGKIASIRDLAKDLGCDRADVGRTMRIAFLAPDIVNVILSGRQPAGLTTVRLKRLPNLPLSWSEQRRILGFNA